MKPRNEVSSESRNEAAEPGVYNSMRLLTLAMLLLSTLTNASASTGMRGKPIDDPAALAGFWQTNDSHGNTIGLWIYLEIAVPSCPIPQPVDVEQSFSVTVFQNNGGAFIPGGRTAFSSEASFSDAGEPGPILHWDGTHLSASAINSSEDNRSVAFDLTFDRKRALWHGFLKKGRFARQVILHRPQPLHQTHHGANTNMRNSDTRSDAIVGIWINHRFGLTQYLHITRTTNGALEAWSDSRTCFKHLPALNRASYGTLLRATRPNAPTEIILDWNAYSAFCCAGTWMGRLSPSGTEMQGGWVEGSIQGIGGPAIWRKIPSATTASTSTCPETNPPG